MTEIDPSLIERIKTLDIKKHTVVVLFADMENNVAWELGREIMARYPEWEGLAIQLPKDADCSELTLAQMGDLRSALDNMIVAAEKLRRQLTKQEPTPDPTTFMLKYLWDRTETLHKDYGSRSDPANAAMQELQRAREELERITGRDWLEEMIAERRPPAAELEEFGR